VIRLISATASRALTVDSISRSQLHRQVQACLIYVDGDYRGRAAYPRRHDRAETDRAGAEGDETRTGMDVQRLEHCARARLDAAP
jgi:hypothetical protein